MAMKMQIGAGRACVKRLQMALTTIVNTPASASTKVIDVNSALETLAEVMSDMESELIALRSELDALKARVP